MSLSEILKVIKKEIRVNLTQKNFWLGIIFWFLVAFYDNINFLSVFGKNKLYYNCLVQSYSYVFIIYIFLSVFPLFTDIYFKDKQKGAFTALLATPLDFFNVWMGKTILTAAISLVSIYSIILLVISYAMAFKINFCISHVNWILLLYVLPFVTFAITGLLSVMFYLFNLPYLIQVIIIAIWTLNQFFLPKIISIYRIDGNIINCLLIMSLMLITISISAIRIIKKKNVVTSISG